MTTDKKVGQELVYLPNVMDFQLRFDAGKYGSRFFAELRDNKRIFANRCPKCGSMFVPPMSFCADCKGSEMSEWVEQGDEGILTNAQVQYYEYAHPRTGQFQKVPWAAGVIQLDGGALISHRLRPPDPQKLKVGERYKAVWKEEGRKGEFFDILYFTKKEGAGPDDKLSLDPTAVPKESDPVSTEQIFRVNYQKTAGALKSIALAALRDEKIMGSRCPQCYKVYAPAKSICDDCFVSIDELVELSGKGILTTYTVVHRPEPAHPVAPPVAYGLIQLDGADTGMCHLLGEIDPDQIEIGMAVVPVFRKERKGEILDIKYFKPV